MCLTQNRTRKKKSLMSVKCRGNFVRKFVSIVSKHYHLDPSPGGNLATEDYQGLLCFSLSLWV